MRGNGDTDFGSDYATNIGRFYQYMSTHHINSITARIPLPPQSLCLRDHIARIAVEDAAYYIQLYYRCTITVPQSLPLTTTNNFPFNPPQALCLRDHIARIAVEDEATLCEAMLMDADSVKEWAEAGSGEERGAARVRVSWVGRGVGGGGGGDSESGREWERVRLYHQL